MTVRLPEYLDLIATAPEGVRKLRGLILELAVRGRLVPQDPNDEPASELLKRIARERARLEAEGSCKKSKPLPAVGEEEQLLTLPKGWEWTRLADLLAIVTDGDHLPPPKADDGIPFLVIGNLNAGRISFDGCRFVPETYFNELDWSRRPTTGDLLYTVTGSYGITIPVTTDAAFCVQRHVAILKSVPSSPTSFLLRYLQSPSAKSFADLVATGIAQKTVTLGALRVMPIAVPPLAEQHRIVAKVDELLALCDRLEAEQTDAGAAHARLVATLLGTLTQSTDAAELAANWQRLAEHFDTLLTTESSLDALKQTILQLAVLGKLVPQDPNDEPASELLKRIAKERARLKAVGACKQSRPLPLVRADEQPFPIPRGWVWTTVESISFVGTGTTPSRTNPAYFNPPLIPWVTSGETRDPFIAMTDEKVSPLALKETSLTVYPVGTLIVAMYGQGKTRGQISELRIEASTNQACSAITPLLPNIELRKYIKLFFEKIYDEIREKAAGGAQPNLNVGKIKATLISLPPLAEQHRIVAKVDELMALCDRLKADLAESRARQQRLATTLIESALEAA